MTNRQLNYNKKQADTQKSIEKNTRYRSTLTGNLLGDVSGATKAMPSPEAARCAPDFIIKFSSVHVRPESQ